MAVNINEVADAWTETKYKIRGVVSVSHINTIEHALNDLARLQKRIGQLEIVVKGSHPEFLPILNLLKGV